MMKSFCSACDHYTMIQGHCSFCGHQMGTVPWRNVWEILEKFLPGLKQWHRPPRQVLKSQVFQKQIRHRGVWLLERLQSPQTDLASVGAYQLELKQIQSWFGGKGVWREFSQGTGRDERTSVNRQHPVHKLWEEWKSRKAFTFFMLLAVLFLAPVIAHIGVRILVPLIQ